MFTATSSSPPASAAFSAHTGAYVLSPYRRLQADTHVPRSNHRQRGRIEHRNDDTTGTQDERINGLDGPREGKWMDEYMARQFLPRLHVRAISLRPCTHSRLLKTKNGPRCTQESRNSRHPLIMLSIATVDSHVQNSIPSCWKLGSMMLLVYRFLSLRMLRPMQTTTTLPLSSSSWLLEA